MAEGGRQRDVEARIHATEQPLYQHYFVKKIVTLAMDRGNREKEAASVLLSRLYPSHLSAEQIQRGSNAF